MFYQYQAPSLKNLAKAFSEKVKGTGDPLKPVWIVIQNNEIKEWLSLFSASENGIFANAHFIYPSEFIWTLYRIKKSDIPKRLPDDRISLQWQLFKLFQNEPELLNLIPAYSPEKIDQKSLFQLCTQLSDVFDQYHVYRPDMTENWLEGRFSTRQKDEKWQARIWKSLNSAWQKSDVIKSLPRRAEIFFDLKKWIQTGELNSGLPDQIFVFGLAQQSAPFLEILTALSSKTDVHFFNTEIPAFSDFHPQIFEHWSKPKKEQASLLNSYLSKGEISGKTVFLEDEEKRKLPEVSIHSCHNKRREVEVLKQQILDFLEQNPGQHADDILILVPEIDSYAGLLETIFNSNSGEPDLPVSNLRYSLKDDVSQAVSKLLDLLGSAYKTTDVLQLLSSEMVLNKFDLSESDLDLIEKWALDNNIFWGLGEKPDSLYSWRRGVNQLLAGFAMEAEPLQLFEKFIPYDGVISTDQLLCAAKLSAFIHALESAENETKTKKTPAKWIDFIRLQINHFMEGDRKQINHKNKLLTILESLQDHINLSEFSGKIPFDLFKNWLSSQLNASSSASGRFGHGITLSTYIPYRSVPFSFIAMLGMNEGEFPRQFIRPDYDLIASEPKPGDRLIKEDDSLLFLETLAAAENHFHISYEGREPKANNKKLPSILVQQLAEEPGNAISVEEHHLHAFNAKYFDHPPKLFSEKAAQLAAIISNGKVKSEAFISPDFKFNPAENGESIYVGDFITFFQNPAKYFVRNVLNASTYNDIKMLADRELFNLNGLDKYSLNQDLFVHLKDKDETEAIRDYLSFSAKIPEGYAGNLSFNDAKSDIQNFVEELKKHLDGNETSVEVDVVLNCKNFVGNIHGLCGKKLVSYRASSLKGRYLAEHFLKHLLLLKNGNEINESVFISKEKDGVLVKHFRSEKMDVLILDDYAEWFFQEIEWQNKLKLFSESSKCYAEQIFKGKDESAAERAAEKAWYDSFRNMGDYSDSYIRLLWDENFPGDDAFQKNAIRFWNPVFEVMEDYKAEAENV